MKKVLLAAVLPLIALPACGSSKPLSAVGQIRESVHDYYAADASENGKAACALMTRRMQETFAKESGTCPASFREGKRLAREAGVPPNDEAQEVQRLRIIHGNVALVETTGQRELEMRRVDRTWLLAGFAPVRRG